MIGCLIAGSSLESSRIGRNWVSQQFQGTEAGIWPGLQRSTALGAVFANALASNALDCDDGYRPVKGHPGASVIPTAFAIAERFSLSGSDLLAGVVAGYEVGLRAGRVLHAEYKDYHCSGSWGSIAAAATFGTLVGADAALADAMLGVAEYQAPIGLMMRCIKDPSMLKDGIAWGAMSGVGSAFLAQEGMTGSPHLLHQVAELSDLGEMERQLLPKFGDAYLIEQVYLKAHACCRWAQPAVEGILILRDKVRLHPSKVKRILVETFEEATKLHVKHPATTEEAQYSLPWAVSSALLYGSVNAQEVASDALGISLTGAISDLVEMVSLPEFDSMFPERTLARVSVTFYDNTVLSSEVCEPKGDPVRYPLSYSDIQCKFLALSVPIIGDVAGNELLMILEDLENMSDLSLLWSRLSGSGVK